MMETKSQNDCKTKKECSYCFECVYVCMCMCWRNQKKKKHTQMSRNSFMLVCE